MKIKSLGVSNVLSFRGYHRLDLDPVSTQLTGANNSGKSNLLKIIAQFARATAFPNYEFVNIDHYLRPQEKADWHHDPEVWVEAELILDGCPACLNIGNPERFKRIVIRRTPTLAPNIFLVKRDAESTWSQVNFNNALGVIDNRNIHPVRDVIDLSSPNISEAGILATAFGFDRYDSRRVQSLEEHHFQALLQESRGRLTEAYGKLIPDLELTFSLTPIRESKNTINLIVSRGQGRPVKLSQQGDGIQRLLSMDASIRAEMQQDKNRPYLILLDEPENTLHPHAHRRLVRYFKDLAAKRPVQTVVTTHSAALLDRWNISSIKRIHSSEHADKSITSNIDNSPYKKNFERLRLDLGIIAGDGLLQSEYVIVAEGETEAFALPELLRILAEGKVQLAIDALNRIERFGLINGQGTKVPVFTQVIEAMGSKAIVLLDGDEEGARIADHIRRVSPNAAVFCLPAHKTFEDVIEPNLYCNTVNGTYGCIIRYPDIQHRMSSGKSRAEAIKAELMRQEKIKPGHEYDKPGIFQTALARLTPDQIELELLRPLFEHIAQLK